MKFARIRQRIGENRFLRSVLILAGGTAFAQGLAAICLPLLTRIYTPADFEVLAVYVAIITLVTVVSCLRYNLAIPIPENDDKALSLLALSVIASIGFTVIISGCVFVFPSYFLLLLGRLDLAPYLWMVPVGVLLASLYNALQYWASRRRHFAIIARTRMARAVGGVGSQLGVGALSSGPFGLIFGHMLYSGLGVFRLARLLWAGDRACLSTLTLSGMRLTASEYRKFPLLSVPEAFFNTAGSQLPILIVAATTLSAEAGYLMLAMRVMGLPMGLIGSSVGQVYLTEAPARLRAGGLKVLTHKTMIALAKTGGIPLFVVGCVSPHVFGYIFGREWEFAGVVVAWLMPSFVLQFVASPVSVLLHVTGQVKEAMWLQMFGCVLRVGAVLMAAAFWPDFQVEFYAVSSALFYLAYIIIVMRVARRADLYAGAG